MCAYVCVHTFILIHTYMHAYIHTYIRTYVHTYIHTYVYTHIYIYTYVFCRHRYIISMALKLELGWARLVVICGAVHLGFKPFKSSKTLNPALALNGRITCVLKKDTIA